MEKKMTVRLHLWLESGQDVYFGRGRVMLLEKIEELGSLRKAAEALGMSYRAAWGKLRRTEKVLGVELVESGGSRRRGCHLTAVGEEYRDKFHQWASAVEEVAVREARRIFGGEIQSYSEKNKARTAGRSALATRQEEKS